MAGARPARPRRTRELWRIELIAGFSPLFFLKQLEYPIQREFLPIFMGLVQFLFWLGIVQLQQKWLFDESVGLISRNEG